MRSRSGRFEASLERTLGETYPHGPPTSSASLALLAESTNKELLLVCSGSRGVRPAPRARFDLKWRYCRLGVMSPCEWHGATILRMAPDGLYRCWCVAVPYGL